MFSDHFRKIGAVSNSKLFLVAGLLVIFCQLLAVAMVAGEQVDKAQLRDNRLAVERMALASCTQTGVGTGRHGCVVQARSTYVVSDDVLPVITSVSGEYGNAEGRAASQFARTQASLAGAMPGLMSVAFGEP